MNNVKRILGIFAASAAMGLGMAGCDNSQDSTKAVTRVYVIPESHAVHEYADDFYYVADFKKEILYKATYWPYGVKYMKIPFADVKNQEDLNAIQRLKNLYDQAMAQKPAVAAPTPK